MQHRYLANVLFVRYYRILQKRLSFSLDHLVIAYQNLYPTAIA
ncbi:MAG: hypothetical protein VKL42_01145 [Snowella sp.]|nr:hypothetical protein [Snowella sp.]